MSTQWTTLDLGPAVTPSYRATNEEFGNETVTITRADGRTIRMNERTLDGILGLYYGDQNQYDNKRALIDALGARERDEAARIRARGHRPRFDTDLGLKLAVRRAATEADGWWHRCAEAGEWVERAKLTDYQRQCGWPEYEQTSHHGRLFPLGYTFPASLWMSPGNTRRAGVKIPSFYWGNGLDLEYALQDEEKTAIVDAFEAAGLTVLDSWSGADFLSVRITGQATR